MGSRTGRTDPIVETLIAEELSASETYRQALELSDERGRGDLRRLENEHRQAACVLRERWRGRAPSARGPWGDWSRAIGWAARAGGGDAAIEALMACEERGVEEYERALECPRLDPELKRLISSTLLPQARSHLPVLDRFLRTTRRL